MCIRRNIRWTAGDGVLVAKGSTFKKMNPDTEFKMGIFAHSSHMLTLSFEEYVG